MKLCSFALIGILLLFSGCDIQLSNNKVSAEVIVDVQSTRDEYMKTLRDVFEKYKSERQTDNVYYTKGLGINSFGDEWAVELTVDRETLIGPDRRQRLFAIVGSQNAKSRDYVKNVVVVHCNDNPEAKEFIEALKDAFFAAQSHVDLHVIPTDRMREHALGVETIDGRPQ